MLEKYVFDQPDQTDLYMYNCGVEDCQPGHHWGPGVRDHFIVHIVVAGKGLFNMGQHCDVLEAGAAFIITPGAVAEYQASADEPWSYLWVGFRGLLAESLCLEAGLSTRHPVIRLQDTRQYEQLVRAMLHLSQAGRINELRRLALLYEFMSNLIAEPGQENQISSETMQEEYLKRAIQYISLNYAGEITVRSIAAHVGLDRSYLYSLFRKHLLLTPKSFLTRYRINKAVELLKTSLSVGEIARSVGYGDALLFSKVFRKEKGISPSEYRKRRVNIQ